MDQQANCGNTQRPVTGKRDDAQDPGDRIRQVRLRTSGATLEPLPGGVFLVRPQEALQPYPRVLTDRIAHWAQVAPDRVCIARRERNGGRRQLTYGSVLRSMRSIGQALLDRGLSAHKPIVILSENDLEHFLLMFAAQHVGVITSSLSPQYSLLSRDFIQLRHILELLKPGMVFVSNGERYGRAIQSAVGGQAEIVCAVAPVSGRQCTDFAQLAAAPPTSAVEAAQQAIQPEDRRKFFLLPARPACPRA